MLNYSRINLQKHHTRVTKYNPVKYVALYAYAFLLLCNFNGKDHTNQRAYTKLITNGARSPHVSMSVSIRYNRKHIISENNPRYSRWKQLIINTVPSKTSLIKTKNIKFIIMRIIVFQVSKACESSTSGHQ